MHRRRSRSSPVQPTSFRSLAQWTPSLATPRAGSKVTSSSRNATEAAPLPFQELLQPGQRQGIDHVRRLEPAAAGLIDSEAHVGKPGRRMRICRDRQFDAGRLGAVRVDIVEVQPIRIGIQLEMAAVPAGCSNYGLHVELISLALADQPATRMTDDRNVTIVHRGDDAFGLRLA